MSFLTAPNDVSLIPSRLRIALSTDALAEPDLKELCRGNVRSILIHRADLREALLENYRHGTVTGRAAFREMVQDIDPGFIARLQS
jgi:hypothetical protein